MIAVIGLGNIGGAMAERIAAAGERVVGVDPDDGQRELWTRRTGQQAVAAAGELGWDSIDRVLIVVRLTSQVESVLDMIGAHLAPDTCVMVSTTLDLAWAKALGDRTATQSRLVELPVSGGQSGARAGTLTLMTAGDLSAGDEDFLRRTIAAEVIRFARFGEPTLAKLINNVTAAYNARAFAEMVILADRLGLDVGQLDRTLASSSGGSWIASAFGDLVDDLLVKDVGLLRQTSDTLPDVSLADPEAFLECLSRARTLLSGDDQRRSR